MRGVVMRNRFAIILIAALLAMGSASAAYADSQQGGKGTMSGSSGSGSSGSTGDSGSGSPFALVSAEGWDGGAYRNSQGEVYCELSDDYGSGVSLILGQDQYGFYLVITDPSTFDLEDMSEFEAMVSIDRIYRGKIPAYSWARDQLELDFGNDRQGINALRKGVKLLLEDWDHWYTLYGTGTAIAAVQDCFSRYR
jgi:hypothetical protein